MNIGFFDSGKGGYFVAEYFQKQFPYYEHIISDDREGVPYGNKDSATLLHLLEKHVKDLFQKDCKLVIVACNTLSTTHLKHIQDNLVKNEYPNRRVLGVAIPTIEEIISSNYDTFLVLGTENTIRSQYFETKIKLLRSDKKIISRAIPSLASLIEQGNYFEAEQLVVYEIDKIKNAYQVIVLACTHYVALKDFLRKKYPEKIIFSQDEIIARKLKEYLDCHPEIERYVIKN